MKQFSPVRFSGGLSLASAPMSTHGVRIPRFGIWLLCGLLSLFGSTAFGQDIFVNISGYEGHDSGVLCGTGASSQLLRNTNGTPVTFCVSITNTSSSVSFSSVTLEIPELGVTNVYGAVGPNGSINAFFETNITGDATVLASITATPVPGGVQTDSNDMFVDAAVECPSECYVVSDVINSSGIDRLYSFNVNTLTSTFVGTITNLAGEGGYCLESLAFEPPLPNRAPKNLYSVDGCRPTETNFGYLVTLDWEDPLVNPSSVPGVMRDVGGPIGIGTGLYEGVVSSFRMRDVDGLDFDDSGTNVVLFATVRIPATLPAGNNPDLLIQLNTNTGSIVHGAFTVGSNSYDFVQIGPVTSVLGGVTTVLYDVDDIAINAAGQMYGIANNSGTEDELILIDKFTGQVIDNFPLRNSSGATFNDMEGLSFSPIQDIFYGTTGSAGGTTANSLFQISLSGTNAGQIVANAFGPGTNSAPIPGTGDYEGSDCFVVDPEAISTITGTVFWDKENDGDFDGSELTVQGINIVLVEDVNTNGVLELVPGGDLVVDFQPTDASGQYQFTVAIGKSYLIVLSPIALPGDFIGYTTPTTYSLDVPFLCGINVIAPDFGLAPRRALGDFIWDDLNQNGIQENGEPGIPGVTVNVYNQDSGAFVDSQLTGANGEYLFSFLSHSNYYIEVIPPGLYEFSPQDQTGDTLDSDVNPGTGLSGPYDLSAVVPNPLLVFTNDTADAGLFLTADYAITKGVTAPAPGTSNLVFDYTLVVENLGNRVGTNVLVTDVIPMGLQYLSDDAGGSYNPTNRLWSLTLTNFPPAAVTNLSLTVMVTNSTIGEVINTACVTNNLPETNLLNNCDDADLSFLGDRVWLDLNANGIQDGGESGVPGVSVELLDAASNVLAVTSTDASGFYGFTLPLGTYNLRFLAPTGAPFTVANVGTNDLVDSDADVVTGIAGPITLAEGVSDDTWDAGLLAPLDIDKTAGPAFPGTTNVTFEYLITVTNSGDLTVDPVVIEDILPVWADYLGSSEPSATYTSSNRLFSVDVGPLGPFASATVVVTAQVVSASLPADMVNTASVNQVIFATQTNAYIGNYVWRDGDNDGVQDMGEIGLANITVRLLADDLQVLSETVTDGSGFYGFIVPPDSYIIEFVPPSGTDFSLRYQGGDTNLDSNADLVTGRSEIVTLSAGVTNLTIDAGLVTPMTLDKTVQTPLASVSNVTFAYTLVVSNESALPADPVFVEDILPSWVQYISDDAGGGVVGNTYTNDIGPLAGNGSRTINILVEVVDPQAGVSLVNTASVNRSVYAVQTNALIGDLVFEDTGRDGLQTGDTGMPGIGVELYDTTTNTLYGSTVTDASGNYYFIVPPGTYRVKVLNPTSHAVTLQDVGGDDTIDSDFSPVDALTAPFTVAAGETNLTIDAGLYPLVPGISVSKTVTDGMTCPGVELLQGVSGTPITYCFVVSNTGETRLGSVSLVDADIGVNAMLAGPLEIGQTVTSSVADVLLMDLTNTVVVTGTPIDTNGFPIVSLPPVTDDDTAEVDLVTPVIQLEKSVYKGWDSGSSCPGVEQVSGVTGDEITYCFLVTNLGDTTLTNVVVDDPLIGPVTLLTDFLAPGDSTSGFVETILVTSVVNTAVATGVPPVGPPVTDTNTASVVRIPPAIIGDFVWDDMDGDGIQDGGEPGISGVVVYIDINTNGMLDMGEPFETTDGSGGYLFTNVAPGTVTLRVDLGTISTNYVNSYDPDGGGDSVSTFTIASGQTDLTQDFGYVIPRIEVSVQSLCIDDAAYVDYTITPVGFSPTNGAQITWISNGTNPVEVLTGQPLSGLLLWPGTVIGTNGVPTDFPGWVFTNGIWVVENDGLRPQMTLEFSVNPVTNAVVTYPPATPFCSADPRATIGDFVWLDVDNNGIQDMGEPGVPGVTVYLLDTNNVAIATNVTDASGLYVFHPRPGTYSVLFDLATLPPDSQVGPQDAGMDDELDSDPNPVTGLVPSSITVTAGVVNVSIDMSVVPLYVIGDTVWYDVNSDGVPNENLGIFGVPNVPVRLFEVTGPASSNLLATVTTQSITNNLGYYAFTNLPPALYWVEVVRSALPPQLTTPTTPLGYLMDLRVSGTPLLIYDFGFEPDPTAIELVSFTAEQAGANVILRWTTGVEIDTLGYNLYRAGDNEVRQRINASLIPAYGAGGGADYAYTDYQVPAGTWQYWLEDLETDLDSAIHGPVEITTLVISPTDPVGEGVIPGRVGLARLVVDNPETTSVLIDGVEVPVLAREDGLLVFVSNADSRITTAESDAPLRMEEVPSAPQDGQTAILVADSTGQVVFTTLPGTDNYLLTGFTSTDIVVLDVTDPAVPRVLTGAALLDLGSDKGAYLHLVPEDEPARVHAAEPRAVIEVDQP